MYNQFIVEGRFFRDKRMYVYQKKGCGCNISVAQAHILTVRMAHRDNGFFKKNQQFLNMVFWGEFADIVNELLIDNGLYVFEGIIQFYTPPFKFKTDSTKSIYGATLICNKVYASKRKADSPEFKSVNGLALHKPAPRRKTTPTFALDKDKDLELVCKNPRALTEKEKQKFINEKLESAAIQPFDVQSDMQTDIMEPQQSYRIDYDPEDF